MTKPCEHCKHVTFLQWLKLNPYQQGYVSYMQAEHPGSELKDHQTNPYPISTPDWEHFNNGQQAAMLEAQDSEE